MGHIYKPCWVWIKRKSLDSIICECWKCNILSILNIDSFGVEQIPKEIRKLIRKKNVITNIHIEQAYNSICANTFKLDLLISC